MQKVNFPFAHKLALSMIVLIVSGMVLLGGLVIHDQNKLLEKQMHSYAKILIRQLSASATEGFLTSDTLDLDVLVKNITQHSEILGISFYSDEKQSKSAHGLIPTTLNFPKTMDEISTLLWFPTSTKTSKAATKTFFLSSNLPYLSYIGSVNYQDVTIGYVLLTFDQSLFIQARNKTLYTIILTTIILIILSIIFAFILGKRLSRPINDLVDASKAISKGDYQFRFDERRNDEFGLLMDSLNVMADGLLHKESVEKAFSRYLSPTVAQEILGNLESIDLGGEQVEASVLFVDIIGFTKLSQTMKPEKTNQLLNEYFSYIAQSAGIYGGHVDKFMGDCVMLVFGVPKKDEHHSYQAISCALLIQRIISELNMKRIAKDQAPINFHIAANSGLVLAGNMGSTQRMEYTVIGDAVNLAARIASHAKDNEVVIPDTMLSCKGVQDNFDIEEKECIKIRGHENPVTLFRVNSCTNQNQINLTKNMDKLINYDFNDK
ncbi:MAG: adenylate/guanylate cyclase domain-containing protein [Gammaproteobacteria bacterium]|nr:adenylate/guanylate cyclase domain-containing protein [Gammaproteobacteria bacterium]